MRRSKTIGALFFVLAIWLQLIAPVAAMVRAGFDPFGNSVICSSSPVQDDGQTHKAPPHHHCLLCQVCHGTPLFPERPAFTALDYPPASPLRWRDFGIEPPLLKCIRPSQPRGPPSLV